MDTPESVRVLMKKCHQDYPNDIPNAAKKLGELVRKLEVFDSIVDQLLDKYFVELIYQARHEANTIIKRNAGWTPPEKPKRKKGSNRAKVFVAANKLVNQAGMQAYLEYSIGGKSLGEIKGRELSGLAVNEAKVAEGHMFNVRLLSYLRGEVDYDQKVKEAFNEAAMERVFRKLHGRDDTPFDGPPSAGV